PATPPRCNSRASDESGGLGCQVRPNLAGNSIACSHRTRNAARPRTSQQARARKRNGGVIMRTVFICDRIRTPISRYGGALSSVRTDDLAAIPLRALTQRNPDADWQQLDEVILGCPHQAGEDNRNVARMALLLAGLPQSVPGATVNRLCASGMEAIGSAARAIAAGEYEFAIAGGVESMSRAPFVMGKADSAFSRSAHIYATTTHSPFI